MTTTKNKMVFDDLFNDVWEHILERAVLAGILTQEEALAMEQNEAHNSSGQVLFTSPEVITEYGKALLEKLGISYFYAYHPELDTWNNQIWILEDVGEKAEWVFSSEVFYSIHRAIDKRAGLGPLVRLGLDSLLVDRKSWASEVIDEELVTVYYRPESCSVKS